MLPNIYLNELKKYKNKFSANFSSNHLIILGINDYKDKICLEIGTNKGYTTRILSFLFKKVITCENNQNLLEFAKEINKDRDNIEFIKKDVYGTTWDFEDIDVVFIDCDHEINSVLSDINNSINLCKSGEELLKHLKEYRVEETSSYEIGNQITVKNFEVGQKVDISGKSMGRGFAGYQKRHGFSRGPMSHGSKNHRAPGSTGAGTTPGRIYPGKRMAGRYGGKQITTKGLLVLKIDDQKNLLVVKGSVPGAKNSLVLIQKNKKNIRSRCSAMIIKGKNSVLIDTSPDIRNQLIDNNIKNISSVIYTHEHSDQTNGLFELRPFTFTKERNFNFWNNKKRINIYGAKKTINTLKKRFNYCFKQNGSYPPIVKGNIINKKFSYKNKFFHFCPIQ